MLGCELGGSEGTRSMGVLFGIQKLLERFEADPSLVEPDRFRERIEALDQLDACGLDSQILLADSESDKSALYRRAMRLRTKLEGANSRFYEGVRDAIHRGAGRDALFRSADQLRYEAPLHGYPNALGAAESYDYLDELVSGVFRFEVTDEPKVNLSAEMVAYQPTPARHIFDLIRHIQLTAQDVFVDLGSGLGHLALLIAICTDARCIGVELEPSYVACSAKIARELNLTKATFLALDAREADLSGGTVFYLYTPFRGAILRAVLDRLRLESVTREIRVCTFGPCTPIVAAESWLSFDPAESSHMPMFRSRR
jgi:Histone methylation protein DOT1